ncbi:branched-chain amino acid transaminase [Pelagicoccus sp. SDUM812005]|uniref:branched-chain amino acid transaminase n=1 Tax=Pelagicoccus sp. SDUM812005 TaxID=3041257 RepID=UPI00280C67DE|nr:branched-chain amino acid transaminase [Pelagicoccus sp. SDUM812005]MDQ8180723.1 branched-chain amino acid transaminase [Pelagicoccus sp. SDUM812005]
MEETEFIWHGGKLIAWKDATVHVMTHALHYGSSVFEGIRVYDTAEGPAFLCLERHLKRFYDSARIYRMTMPFEVAELRRICHEVIRANKLTSAYVRPLAFRGYGPITVYGNADPVEVTVAAFPWGAYLGEDALENGVDVGVSSWTRVAPNTLPTMAKAGGNYLSSQLITMEAHRHGYTEGIGLDASGHLSEGAGENIFVVRDGVLLTPPITAAILPGITRSITIDLAQRLGYEVREESLPRELLYVADEVFMTGTATEIAAIRSVDGLTVGSGKRGVVTEQLQKAFFGLFDGSTEDTRGWLEKVE